MIDVVDRTANEMFYNDNWQLTVGGGIRIVTDVRDKCVLPRPTPCQYHQQTKQLGLLPFDHSNAFFPSSVRRHLAFKCM